MEPSKQSPRSAFFSSNAAPAEKNSSSMFDLSQKDDIKLTRMDRVQQIMAELEDLAEEKPEQADRTVHIILFGCMWCYPSYITLRHAHELIYSSKSKGDSKSTNEEFGGPIVLHLIDEEAEREYCDQSDIMVGSSVLFAMVAGKNLLFKRLNWPRNDRLIGPFNKASLKEIFRASIAAVRAKKRKVEIDV
mmetsp:Transcript_26730/g.47358  ORF Transcript_26730/g.47358 Transcript_26730/m.47358 type:complete len:190 (-) Transcript_26730:89-658(-)